MAGWREHHTVGFVKEEAEIKRQAHIKLAAAFKESGDLHSCDWWSFATLHHSDVLGTATV